jgi:hypothetical protein
MSSRRRSSGGGRSTLKKGMQMSVLEKQDYVTQISHQSTSELITGDTNLPTNV